MQSHPYRTMHVTATVRYTEDSRPPRTRTFRTKHPTMSTKRFHGIVVQKCSRDECVASINLGNERVEFHHVN